MAGDRLFLVFLLAVVAAVPAIATDYNVGDAQGWDLNVNYANWVSGKTFKVGDNLVFKYTSNHNLEEVNQADYNSCSSNNVIRLFNSGDTIPLNTTGSRYFICGIGNHCTQGMKLTVSVSPAASSPPPSTTPSPPSSSPPPTTPVSGGPETPPTSTSPPPPPSPSGAMTTSSYYNMNTLLFSAILLCVALLG
ncbi:hypothetical protein J5N97_025202 [Dioscorea zingiberensis]|uniref:Phytocyanin domain-containing protein n=1 Tax=Dioscorea zingiberensis TaxID=325984 RepID=A0A9D5C8G9_9LILI|nr:hypothetical protein J5N97_025202 [Dioscorea zingiberensis]